MSSKIVERSVEVSRNDSFDTACEKVRGQTGFSECVWTRAELVNKDTTRYDFLVGNDIDELNAEFSRRREEAESAED